jgi:hypothetical protein
LTAKDLRTDPILVRKIKRMQQAEADEAEESSDDEDGSDADSVTMTRSVQRPASQQQPPPMKREGRAGSSSEQE